MADTHNWMDGWLQAQQRYWQAWAELAQNGMKAPEPPRNPLAEGLDQWWKAVAPMTPPAGREVFDKLMDVSRGYFTLVERCLGNAQGMAGAQGAIDGWLDGMRKTWSEWQQGGSAFRADTQFKGLTTFWDLPMDTWNRLAANVMPMPGDFTQAFHPEGASPLREQLNRFLSIPAVGYTRESQEQFQILAQRQMDYAVATQTYQAAFGKLGLATTSSFQQALQERVRSNQPLSSLRDVYDLWVEMSEASYAEFVMTEEYQGLYGRLVNSLLALKQHLARMVDEALEAMHMPSNAEIKTLQLRQQEVRRENLRLRKQVQEIGKQLDGLRQALLHAPRPAEAAEPRPDRKPAERPAARRSRAATAADGASTAPSRKAVPTKPPAAKAGPAKAAPRKTAAAKKTR